MKLNQRLIALIVALTMAVNLFVLNAFPVFAHDAILDVDYDACTCAFNSDGIDEMWYVLEKNSLCYHLPDETTTIKYYFEEVSAEGYTWTTDVSEAVAMEIKDAYASSMEKWNNVYFYSYDDDGTLTKNKIINVIEGTEADHNLSIYPAYLASDGKSIATTIPCGSYDQVESGAVSHRHSWKWEMTVYIANFYLNENSTLSRVNWFREATGAHELGHVFGLRDIDNENICNSGATSAHHQEVLMGYGKPLVSRSSDITYKDIAGVAITRGFHSDYDHQWLNCGLQDDGRYKLLCSICNGVKIVESLSEYTYSMYNSCEGEHDLSSGNMMAVASYGNQDYYKCRYCRYVAPFSSIVTQNYIITNYSDTHHKYVNNITGLEYTFYEEHNSYTYNWLSATQHQRMCECGNSSTHPHVVRASSFPGVGGFAICLLCHGRATIGVIYGNSVSSLPHTQNGSYVLPNGTIVLVDEDIDAYLNGSLTFYSGETQ